jgi:hypothetical protein
LLLAAVAVPGCTFGAGNSGNGGDGTYAATLVRTAHPIGDASVDCVAPKPPFTSATFVVSGHGASLTVQAPGVPSCVLSLAGDDIGGTFGLPAGCAGVPANSPPAGGSFCFDGPADCGGEDTVSVTWKPTSTSKCNVNDLWTATPE